MIAPLSLSTPENSQTILNMAMHGHNIAIGYICLYMALTLLYYGHTIYVNITVIYNQMSAAGRHILSHSVLNSIRDIVPDSHNDLGKRYCAEAWRAKVYTSHAQEPHGGHRAATTISWVAPTAGLSTTGSSPRPGPGGTRPRLGTRHT